MPSVLVFYESLMRKNEDIYYCLEMKGNSETPIVSVKLPYFRVSNDHVWRKLQSGRFSDPTELTLFGLDPADETAIVSYYLWVQDNLYRMYAMVASKRTPTQQERLAKVVYGLCFTDAVIKVIDIFSNIIMRNFNSPQKDAIAIVKRSISEEFSFIYPIPPIHIAFLNAGFRGAVYTPCDLDPESVQVPTINLPVKIVRIFQEGLEDVIENDFNYAYVNLANHFLPHDQIGNQRDGSIIIQYIGHYRGSRVSEGLQVRLDNNQVDIDIIDLLNNISNSSSNLKLVNLTACETASSWRDGDEPVWEGPGLGLAERVVSEANIPCVYATLWVTYSNHLSSLTHRIYTKIILMNNNNDNPILVHSNTVREELEELINAFRNQPFNINNIIGINNHELEVVEEQIHAMITQMGYICVIGGRDGARQTAREATN